MIEERRKRPLWPWFLGAGLLVVLVLGQMGNSGSGHNGTQANTGTSQSDYSAGVTGRLPTIQYVGQTTDVSLTVKNTGKDIPQLVIDTGGCNDHWVLDGISSDTGDGQRTSGGDYWVFGRLSAGQTWHGTVTVTPKDAGNHDCDIGVYRDIDAGTGIPNGDPLGLLKGAVAINP